jgi:hypothetical protein
LKVEIGEIIPGGKIMRVEFKNAGEVEPCLVDSPGFEVLGERVGEIFHSIGRRWKRSACKPRKEQESGYNSKQESLNYSCHFYFLALIIATNGSIGRCTLRQKR